MDNRRAIDYGPVTDRDLDALNAVLEPALHFPAGGMRDWIAVIGAANFRAVRLGDEIVAGLGFVPMGQWFGGARMEMTGVTAVGVAPAYRGTGIGSQMLRAALAELDAAGVPLSGLYPATLPFYRRAGYERAAQRISYELPLDAIDSHERSLALAPIEDGAYDEVYHVYEERARRAAGFLDRPAWMWRQKLEPKDRHPFRFLVQREGHTEGYVIFTQGGRNDPLTVLDACVLTPAAGHRILALFAGYSSMVENVVWNGGPLDPFIYLLHEPTVAGARAKVKVLRSLDWMLRIVDVAGALSGRGYPSGINAELQLELRDDVLATNSGRWILKLADGQATLKRGGDGRIRMDVRDLAALYTGFIAPVDLQVLGNIEGPAADLALMGSIFAGPRPSIVDMF